MRVCHITTSHEPFDTRIFRRECVSLVKAGFDVSLIAPHVREETVDGVHVLPIRKPTSFFERVVMVPRAAINFARSIDADLYHFHDPEMVPWMRRFSQSVDRPIVWDAHENYCFTIPQFNSFRIQSVSNLAAKWFDRVEMEACVKHFAGVVTVSEKMAERYTRMGIRTCVSGNYADISSIAHPPVVQRAGRPRFVSTGGQFVDRGVLAIVDAFNIVRADIDCELAFWGTFSPPRLAHDLRTRAEVNGRASGTLTVGGPFPWKVLVGELIPTAWAGCVLFNPGEPNDLNGLPNRFFECWANSVPVIATSGTEVGRLIEEEGGGFVVDHNSPQAIALAFRTLAGSPDLVTKMGGAGRHAVEAKYNWATTFKNMLNLYAEVGVSVQSPENTPPGYH